MKYGFLKSITRSVLFAVFATGTIVIPILLLRPWHEYIAVKTADFPRLSLVLAVFVGVAAYFRSTTFSSCMTSSFRD